MESLTLPQLTAVCRLTELPEGLGRAFRVGGRSVAVFRTRAGQVFALDQVCPHRGGPLADGMVIGTAAAPQVVCPLHAFRFSIATGACDQPGVCGVNRYPVEVRDGVVFVGTQPV
jgi:NAD(P)H-dependent nitrite reductase small subunit